MNTYDGYVSKLADPERFDAALFRSEDGFTPELCDFVLSLALAYNDLRDLIFAWMLLGDIYPTENRPSARAGQAGGLTTHLFRMLTGFIHELLVLIDNSKQARRDPEFAKILKRVHRDARKAWEALVGIEKGSKSSDPLARYVYWARNQVAFHYDTDAIRRGYELAFADQKSREPWASCGRSMASSRFYFADAAVDAYMRDSARADAPSIKQLLRGNSEVIKQINHALREIVTEYIRRRKALLAKNAV